jgi:hypothetical protein
VTKTDADSRVDDYLRKLDESLQQVAPQRRDDLIQAVSEHICQGRAALADQGEAAVLDLLDKLGRPEEIAVAAMSESDELTPRSLTARNAMLDGLAIGLLLLGGFALLVGWFVGVVLLWRSGTWRIRDKLLGTLFFPGGLLLPVLFVLGHGRNAFGKGCVENIPAGGTPVNHCTSTIPPSWSGIAILLAVVVVPILVAIHLQRSRRLRRTYEG